MSDSGFSPGERDPLMLRRGVGPSFSRLPGGHVVPMSRTFGSTEEVKSVSSVAMPKGHLVEHARIAALKENRAQRLQRSREWQAKYKVMKDGMLQFCTRLQSASSPCILGPAPPVGPTPATALGPQVVRAPRT